LDTWGMRYARCARRYTTARPGRIRSRSARSIPHLQDTIVHISRRSLLKAPCAAVLAGTVQQAGAPKGSQTMFGLIGKMKAVAGQREALIGILLEGTRSMPGCLSYIVARDTSDPDGIWITEVWDSRESHAASLK